MPHLPRVFPYLLALLLLGGCVTVNIYFPAAEAEQAARTIVKDVLQGADRVNTNEPAPAPAAPEPQSRLWRGLLDLLVPPARAAANIHIDTPAIARLRRALKARAGQLAPFYRSGAIGFGNDGFVAIRDLGKVPLRDRNRLKKLVADENRDRRALYREIAHANGHPEWEDEIRRTFAKVWVDEAPAGYWYQDAAGQWHRK